MAQDLFDEAGGTHKGTIYNTSGTSLASFTEAAGTGHSLITGAAGSISFGDGGAEALPATNGLYQANAQVNFAGTFPLPQ
jgi:hypothetical protein